MSVGGQKLIRYSATRVVHLRNKSIEAISADEDFTASKLNSSTGMSCSNDPVFTRTEYITKTRFDAD